MGILAFTKSAGFIPLAFLACAVAGAATAPQRIISTSPSVTEILYGVGAFDRVVAVSEYCTYPPAVKSLPRVGKWADSNLEEIVSLHPDLVILTHAQAPFLEGHLRDLGIHSLSVPDQTLKDVFAAIDLIGKATGHEAQARELSTRVHARLDAVRARTRALPRRRVLLIVDRTPGTLHDLYAVTKGGFLADLIEIAGGDSVAAPAKIGYGKLSEEAVVDLNPQIIIDFVHGTSSRLGENARAVWGDLPEVEAVRTGQVYPVNNEFLPHPSQFVADTAELFAGIIHREAAH
jgi:iron complex transport system substrate-binding protein